MTSALTSYIAISLQVSCQQDDLSCEIENEIIEIGAVTVELDGTITNQFHALVKPCFEPELTEFCQKETGITQQQIDVAQLFPDVISEFTVWVNCQQAQGWISWGKGDAVLLSADCARTDSEWPFPDDFTYIDARCWALSQPEHGIQEESHLSLFTAPHNALLKARALAALLPSIQVGE
ncbi:MAG: exonuclease domain-containing protein [Plesiomonas sp.]|uniref:exonuclease domain-containing protein n=1 Tax=Plesiomonas sp. TaxID=2486279 RepID=UPI003F34F728